MTIGASILTRWGHGLWSLIFQKFKQLMRIFWLIFSSLSNISSLFDNVHPCCWGTNSSSICIYFEVKSPHSIIPASFGCLRRMQHLGLDTILSLLVGVSLELLLMRCWLPHMLHPARDLITRVWPLSSLALTQCLLLMAICMGNECVCSRVCRWWSQGQWRQELEK